MCEKSRRDNHLGFQRDKERSETEKETGGEHGTGYQESVRDMMCPSFTRDATGSWTCGAPGRICNQKYNDEITCGVKPKLVQFQPCHGFHPMIKTGDAK